jgi:hypothetical protein
MTVSVGWLGWLAAAVLVIVLLAVVIAAALAVARAGRLRPRRPPPGYVLVRLPPLRTPSRALPSRPAPVLGGVRTSGGASPASDEKMRQALDAANRYLAGKKPDGLIDDLQGLYGFLYTSGGPLEDTEVEVAGDVDGGRIIPRVVGDGGRAPPLPAAAVRFHTHPPADCASIAGILRIPSATDIYSAIWTSHRVTPHESIVVCDYCTWTVTRGPDDARFEVEGDYVVVPVGVLVYLELVSLLAAYSAGPFAVDETAAFAAEFARLHRSVSLADAVRALAAIDHRHIAAFAKENDEDTFGAGAMTLGDILGAIRRVDGVRLCRIECARLSTCPARYELPPGDREPFPEILRRPPSEGAAGGSTVRQPHARGVPGATPTPRCGWSRPSGIGRRPVIPRAG